MASPTVDAIDFLLVSFGVAPFKVLGYMWYQRRMKKREDALKKALLAALSNPEEG